MARRPPRQRTRYSRAVGRLGPAPRWATLTLDEKIALTSERARRFYEQIADERLTLRQRCRAVLWWGLTIDRLASLMPNVPPTAGNRNPSPEARTALARAILAAKAYDPLSSPPPTRLVPDVTRWQAPTQPHRLLFDALRERERFG
jgi:hypothetical protein